MLHLKTTTLINTVAIALGLACSPGAVWEFCSRRPNLPVPCLGTTERPSQPEQAGRTITNSSPIGVPSYVGYIHWPWICAGITAVACRSRRAPHSIPAFESTGFSSSLHVEVTSTCFGPWGSHLQVERA